MAAISVDTIREAFLSRLSTDASFRTIVGYSAADPRVYYNYQPKPVIDTGHRAYATYRLLPHGETKTGVVDPIFIVNIWSQEQYYASLKSAVARFFALFDQKAWTIGTQRAQSRVVTEADIDNPGAGFVGRTLHLRVSGIHLPSV